MGDWWTAQNAVLPEAQPLFEHGYRQGWQERDSDGHPRYPGLTKQQAADRAEFERGRKIGLAEREAELLEQGWTPPGAVTEFEVSTGPTDYEVWRDALTLAGTNVFPIDGTGEAGTFDDDRKAQLRAEAEWWWNELQDVPVLKNDDGTDTEHERIDGDETSWGPMPTIDPTNTPIDDPRDAGPY